MRTGDIHILSTKAIGSHYIEIAERQGISIDEIPFIEIQTIQTPEVNDSIRELAGLNIIAVFTSANALNAVRECLPFKPHWKIFCIGYKTKKKVAEVFGVEAITGTADNGELLATEMLKHPVNRRVVFFCGNQRGEVLPSKLRSNGINLEELVVYNTIEKNKTISKSYDGIVFFSPSAVRSLFSTNKLSNKPRLFAIGVTTARQIASFSALPVMRPEHPDPGEIINLLITTFKPDKIS